MIQQLLSAFIGLNEIVLAVVIARQFERRWPIEIQSHREIVADWKATGANIWLAAMLGPLTLPISAALVHVMGGGFIHLRTDGLWWYAASLIGYVIVTDLSKYWYHRMIHAVPLFWRMHSFHHSAEALTFFTGGRHYWLERVLAGAFLPILPIIFDAPVGLAGVVAFIFFLPESCAHLNVKFPMGRAITWVNTPQWHRIHHSTQAEHHDKNFAALLPLWDLIFGTAWIPQHDEYPATGLEPNEQVGVIDSIVWPFRHYLRRPVQANLLVDVPK